MIVDDVSSLWTSGLGELWICEIDCDRQSMHRADQWLSRDKPTVQLWSGPTWNLGYVGCRNPLLVSLIPEFLS